MGGLAKTLGMVPDIPKPQAAVRMPQTSDADRLQQERDKQNRVAMKGREGTKLANDQGAAYSNDLLGS